MLNICYIAGYKIYEKSLDVNQFFWDPKNKDVPWIDLINEDNAFLLSNSKIKRKFTGYQQCDIFINPGRYG